VWKSNYERAIALGDFSKDGLCHWKFMIFPGSIPISAPPTRNALVCRLLSNESKEIGMKTLVRVSQATLALIGLTLTVGAFAQGAVDLDNEDNQIAYALGANIGSGIQQQGLTDGLDSAALLAGLSDALDGELKMDDNSIMAALQSLVARQEQAQQSAIQGNLAASEAWLAENAAKSGVVSLDSGLQYEIIESGPAGGASPALSDSVLAHYHGTLTDGSVFDSSVERGEPAQFGLSQVISGWTEALQLMKVGDKWRLFIPPAMAYGEASPTPAIPPNSALIFEVELLEIR
jgi:FKBP-type peptidyl-prolyl cis-trans isomerase FklB